MGKNKEKKSKKSIGIYISIVAVLLLLQIIAWNSRAFSDAYIAYIFPIWVNTYGRITGIFPFSVGEWMIVAGILVILLAILLGCSMILPWCRHSKRFRRSVRGYFCFFAWTLLAVFAIMTLNCTMIYHGSTFSEKYFGGEEEQQELLIPEDIIDGCHDLCDKFHSAFLLLALAGKRRTGPVLATAAGSESARKTFRPYFIRGRKGLATLSFCLRDSRGHRRVLHLRHPIRWTSPEPRPFVVPTRARVPESFTPSAGGLPPFPYELHTPLFSL